MDANDCLKLLDNEWSILLYKNGLGSYTAMALREGQSPHDLPDECNQITDDWTPAKALYRLAEKMTGNIADTSGEKERHNDAD